MRMFSTTGWLVYAIVAVGLTAALALGLSWWVGLAFAAAFAALPALALVVEHRRP